MGTAKRTMAVRTGALSINWMPEYFFTTCNSFAWNKKDYPRRNRTLPGTTLKTEPQENPICFETTL
jgi:hypothetical protein